VARLLRQRDELGAGPIVFRGITREEALAASSGKVKRGPVVRADRVPEPGAVAETSIRSATDFDVPESYDALKEAALACTRCRLAKGRTQVVFSDGNPEGRLMVVGEAPGAHEDRTGLPFVGPAGKLLDLLLATIGLSRETSVYICNVIKCRPPENRNPSPDEIEACAPYLRRQIERVRPEVILAVGTFAGQLLAGTDRSLGKLRGEVYSYAGIPLVVTYHPAALLRNSGWIRPTWDDLQLLSKLLDSKPGARPQ
jgi:DNA polymerase